MLWKTEGGRNIQLDQIRVPRCDIVNACGASCWDSLAFSLKETNFCSRGNQRRRRLVPVGRMSQEMHHNYLMKSNISGVALFMSIFYASLGIKIRFIEMHLTRYCNRNSKLVIIFRSAFFLNRTTYPPPLQACCIIHHCCIMEFSILFEKNDTAYTALYILPFWNALIKVVVAKPLTLSIRYTFSRIRCSLRSIQLWVRNILQFAGPPLPK